MTDHEARAHGIARDPKQDAFDATEIGRAVLKKENADG